MPEKNESGKLQQAINHALISLKKQTEQKKHDPPCARCHKQKKTTKHHFPLGSTRLVPICNSCYIKVKKQRNRVKKYRGF